MLQNPGQSKQDRQPAGWLAQIRTEALELKHLAGLHDRGDLVAHRANCRSRALDDL